MLISKGNLKLGTLPSFSLPVMLTCPGKTPFCERYCFGLRGRFSQEKLKEINNRRLDATMKPNFGDIIVEEIRQVRAPAFRLHVVGDFYSVEYIEKWIDIAERLPRVIFFGSTRSWRCRPLAEAMKRFRDMVNVFMKASIDFTDPQDPVLCGWYVWSVEGEGQPCPHDYGLAESCAVCKRCWTIRNSSTSFRLRWGKKSEYLTPSIFK